MKALILAAGYGKRLRPITNTIPKSMVEVNGIPLLANALNCLADCGCVDRIGIVVGHMADYIKKNIGDAWKGTPIEYYENPRYLETNNVVSFYEAVDFCDDDMVMMECDLFYRRELVECLLKGSGECSILVSDFDKGSMDGTVVRVKDDIAQELVLGQWQSEDFDYTNAKKTVNMYKFSKNFVADRFAPLVKWYVEHMGENSYYEKVLGSLMYYRECDMRIVEVPKEMWCEIDDVEDLNRAREMFQ